MKSSKKALGLIVKTTLNIVGTISLVLGIIGIFLPLLPTTPFLLLASICYIRGSKKLHDKLINSKYLGEYIRNFKDKKGIPAKAKYYTIILLWASIGISMYIYIYNNIVLLTLFVIGVSITIVILKSKTLKMH